MPPLVGIDGCRAGWMVASADGSRERFSLRVVPRMDAIFERIDRLGGFVAIDVPIGLSDDDSRECDLAARALLKVPRKSSVFPAPCRVTLTARSYREACDLNARASGKKVTRELFNILPRIREVDLLMSPSRQRHVHESHPEVIFATLAGPDAPALPPKREADGQARRIEILGRFLPGVSLDLLRRERSRLVRDLPDEAVRDITQEWEDDGACQPADVGRTGPTRRRPASSDLALDDLIDALACLVTANRIRTGEARVFPEGPARLDARGLRMEIVA